MSKEKKTTKADFTFVGQDRKVYDAQIEGKPIGYLQDAFIRFRRNKVNIVAAIVLIMLVMMAILVPALTKKNYTQIEEQLTYLTPRVPILEKFGIFDGTKKVRQEIIDETTIDEETGLGLPAGYDIDYVNLKSLKNFRAPAQDSGPQSKGGQLKLTLASGDNKYIITRPERVDLDDTGVKFQVKVTDVEELEGGKIELYILYFNKKHVIGEITEPGTYEFDLELDSGSVRNREIYVALSSENPKANVSIEYIKASKGTTELFNDSGHNLYSYEYKEGKGAKVRVNAYSIYASFEYDQYKALFSTRQITIGGNEYDQIRAENPVGEPVEDPENPGQFIFEDGYVIKRIIAKSSITIDGIQSTTYILEVDYAQYMGYKNIPYFLFGTDASGKDLFALTWVGLRTSLIIGVIVSIINISFGVVYGAISGYYGGKIDLVMERITEVIGRIPWLVTLSIFTALIGPGFLTLILILIISGWIGVASVTRTQFYRYKNREYVLASRTLGAKDRRLIFRHILPNGIGTIITSSILMIPGVIFSESSISYLGFGIGHGQDINFLGIKLSGASLGVLLADGQTALLDFPHLTIYPAIIISILMITFNLFGNGLRDAFNPSLRGTE